MHLYCCGVILSIVFQAVKDAQRGIGLLFGRSHLRMDSPFFYDFEPLVFMIMGLLYKFFLESYHLYTVLYIFFEVFG